MYQAELDTYLGYPKIIRYDVHFHVLSKPISYFRLYVPTSLSNFFINSSIFGATYARHLLPENTQGQRYRHALLQLSLMHNA